MAYQNSPRIITNGLVLCLDAGNTKSYPGTGNTWSDISNNSKSGTLVNAPTFSSANNGKIVFNGTNNYITFPTGFLSGITNSTFSVWFYWTDNAAWSRIFDFGTGTNAYMFLTPKSGGTSILRYAITNTGNLSEQQINSTALSLNTWYNVVVTINGSTGSIYVNNVLKATNASMTLTPNSLGSTNLNYMGKSQFADPYFGGNISNFMVYSRALNASEILQNYNAIKTRFGL